MEKEREIAAAIPNCAFQLIKEAGHMPWIDQPATCAKIITPFIK